MAEGFYFMKNGKAKYRDSKGRVHSPPIKKLNVVKDKDISTNKYTIRIETEYQVNMIQDGQNVTHIFYFESDAIDFCKSTTFWKVVDGINYRVHPSIRTVIRHKRVL